MSWAQIKIALNSLLGTKNEKTIDEIIKEVLNGLE